MLYAAIARVSARTAIVHRTAVALTVRTESTMSVEERVDMIKMKNPRAFDPKIVRVQDASEIEPQSSNAVLVMHSSFLEHPQIINLMLF